MKLVVGKIGYTYDISIKICMQYQYNCLLMEGFILLHSTSGPDPTWCGKDVIDKKYKK
jgi:hypothetical protein